MTAENAPAPILLLGIDRIECRVERSQRVEAFGGSGALASEEILVERIRIPQPDAKFQISDHAAGGVKLFAGKRRERQFQYVGRCDGHW